MIPSRKTFFILGLITLFGFSALGYVIILVFQKDPFIELFTSGADWKHQVLHGTIFATIAVACLLWMVRLPILKDARDYFSNLIQDANLKWPDIIFVSFCAGVGEEILFRGALQPFFGIWTTAFVFVALHGYINPFSWRMTMYGLLMLVVSAGLGYLFAYQGIYAAMTAHFLIDVGLFARFRYIKSG